MTKYFTRDTSLYGLERMMMSVPRFAPRHSGVEEYAARIREEQDLSPEQGMAPIQ